MKRSLITFILAILVFHTISYGQKHSCGTKSDAHARRIVQQNKLNIVHSKSQNTTVYVPVTFHMVGDNDGGKRINYSAVLNQLCKLNLDYQDQGIVFYLSDIGFNLIDNLGVFSNPNAASNIQRIIDAKDDSAMNIFITENADIGGSTGEGVTLGFYSLVHDYVICRKNEFVDTTSTISHEVGHFFSLMHPHAGWEDVPWSVETYGNVVNISTIGSSQTGGQLIPVELVDGSNCQEAGDLVCDTPPDYNFGFTSPGCVFIYEVYDANNDQIFPQVDNYMGYFNNCNKYVFTTEQGNIMKADYDSERRSYLRSDYVPNTDAIDTDVRLNQPTTGTQFEYYSGIYLDWEPVAGASRYLIELSAGAQTLSYFSDTDEITLNDLEPNTDYFWIIKPFNESTACVTSPSYYFKTGDTQTATNELSGINEINLYPNPVQGSEKLALHIRSDIQSDISIRILDMQGRVVLRKKWDVRIGENRIPLKSSLLTTGTYIVSISNTTGQATQKLVVQ